MSMTVMRKISLRVADIPPQRKLVEGEWKEFPYQNARGIEFDLALDHLDLLSRIGRAATPQSSLADRSLPDALLVTKYEAQQTANQRATVRFTAGHITMLSQAMDAACRNNPNTDPVYVPPDTHLEELGHCIKPVSVALEVAAAALKHTNSAAANEVLTAHNTYSAEVEADTTPPEPTPAWYHKYLAEQKAAAAAEQMALSASNELVTV